MTDASYKCNVPDRLCESDWQSACVKLYTDWGLEVLLWREAQNEILESLFIFVSFGVFVLEVFNFGVS